MTDSGATGLEKFNVPTAYASGREDCGVMYSAHRLSLSSYIDLAKCDIFDVTNSTDAISI